jgi:integration host factor subunit beta
VPYFKPSKELRDLVNPGEASGAKSKAASGHEAHVVDPHHPPAM